MRGPGWKALALMVMMHCAAYAEDQSWTPVISDSMTDEPSGHPPPRMDPLAGPEIRLKAKERWGVELGARWAAEPDFPARGRDGSILFLYGATLPVLVCAPLHVCDLTLEPGEAVNDLHIGDGVRWQITPAIQGAGSKTTTHVMIKPTDTGLATNLVITTNRRSYTLKLVSRRRDWMPRVAFFYPEDLQSRWRAYRAAQDRNRERQVSFEADTDESAAHLDFAYAITGDDPPWRPVRVYASGAKTYIQFPPRVRHGDLPALVALADDGGLFSEPSKQLVNYRYVNERFEVDKVLERAALISGVGRDQQSVRITRQNGNSR